MADAEISHQTITHLADGVGKQNLSNGDGHCTYALDSHGLLKPTLPEELHDLICVGFGPASLAIAVALHDALEALERTGNVSESPRVVFLERQNRFRWHSGMLLPGTKMQISFIKDLATLRDPRSNFTFLNYLKSRNRIVQFSNLATFLPSRVEFEDYLRWAAAHFENVVEYSRNVTNIRPCRRNNESKVYCFEVETQDTQTARTCKYRSKKIVIAAGGSPFVPGVFPCDDSRILHSSEYNTKVEKILPISSEAYDIAVVGSGQSAAEVFEDLQSRYKNARTRLIFRDTALRPSDDSPFVNEVFDPVAVDTFFSQPEDLRDQSLKRNKNTNYGVVRPDLLEKLYENQYLQSVRKPNRSLWQHRILPSREISHVSTVNQSQKITLTLETLHSVCGGPREVIEVDAVVLATGYERNNHLSMLESCKSINGSTDGQWQVRRDYSLKLNPRLVESDVGVWLQGHNEDTHGLSDTLLSILASRSGELVDSIFGCWGKNGHKSD